eukprot:TRINITY_DN10054_c0_g1_i1.p2 TRINITY_DN10054_c0_g1~~TRINITY_DN10054_c0_g1_i1.p2  ORF type:complete len:139 (+),score=21.81 TRINITY_DN10054_c0_g1_i1:325-741(+)
MTFPVSETAFADTIPDVLFEDVAEDMGGVNEAAEHIGPARPVGDTEAGHTRPRYSASTTAATTPDVHELDFSTLLPTREHRGSGALQFRDPYGRRGSDRWPPLRSHQLMTRWDEVQLWKTWGIALVVLLGAIASLMID